MLSLLYQSAVAFMINHYEQFRADVERTTDEEMEWLLMVRVASEEFE